jgi:hypothetical protein
MPAGVGTMYPQTVASEPSFFTLSELRAADHSARAGVLDAMLRGDTHGVLVRGVLSAEALAPALARLHDPDALALVRRDFSPRFPAHSYGLILDHAGADLQEYFAAAPEYARFCRELFGGFDLEAHVLAVLRGLCAPRAVEVAVHPQHGRYGFSTLRVYPPGGGRIPPHSELEQWPRPSYAHLRSELREGTLFSWYLMLSAPEAGGELRIHELLHESAGAAEIFRDRRVAEAVLAQHRHVDLRQAAGDLIFFNGGHHFHEVLAVTGALPRWTLGGFAALRRDGTVWLYS